MELLWNSQSNQSQLVIAIPRFEAAGDSDILSPRSSFRILQRGVVKGVFGPFLLFYGGAAAREIF